MKWLVTVITACGAAVAGPVAAESLVAAHTISARSVISPEDVRLTQQTLPGALSAPEEALGKEARVTIYSGRPVRAGDIGPPALVERNDIVRLRYVSSALVIEADGRALGRGAAGDRINVMNLASRTTVAGQISPEGLVEVTR